MTGSRIAQSVVTTDRLVKWYLVLAGGGTAAGFTLLGGAGTSALPICALLNTAIVSLCILVGISRLRHGSTGEDHTDFLTTLPDRAAFFSALSQQAATSMTKTLAIGLFSLDKFGAINDVNGHIVGDRLLAELAGRLRAAAGSALIARLGGDKFGFLMHADEEAAEAFGQKLCALASEIYEIDALRLKVGCSCGIAFRRPAGDAPDFLFDQAYYALRTAKSANPGRVTLYDAALEQHIRSTRRLEAALLACDPLQEMQILFQPIRDIETGRTTLVEALARWTNPVLGPVPPNVFITAAERLGIIHAISLTLFRKTLAELQRLPEDIDVSFNLSAQDVADPQTVRSITALVREMDVDPRRITLEITETAVMRNFETAIDAVRLFRSLGMRVALDDFGTGYSSLSYLHRMAFDKVKIDRSFVGLVEQPEGRQLLASVVGLCINLDLECIVEGVETQAQLRVLEEIGCKAYQGYLLAKPMTPDAFLDWNTTQSTFSPRLAQ